MFFVPRGTKAPRGDTESNRTVSIYSEKFYGTLSIENTPFPHASHIFCVLCGGEAVHLRSNS